MSAQAPVVRELWAAPVATRPVDATVIVPGSKSLTNRALVLAALADTTTRIDYPLDARDTRLMAAALRQLGAEITFGASAWHVRPPTTRRGDATIDCGLAGTVMRFVPPLAALTAGTVRFDGDPQARTRPMGPVLTALRRLGVRVVDEGSPTLPFLVEGVGRVHGGDVTLDASASSQFVSGLLLAGCRYETGLTVRHDGPPLPSRPHVEMTLAGLRDRGVVASELGSDTWRVEAGIPSGGEASMEPDLSNAAPFLGAALLTGGRVSIPGWPARTNQPGDLLREVLSAMGGAVSLERDGLVVSGTGQVHGVDMDLGPAGELTPVIAALAAVADAPTTLSGIAHLRGHETDRLAALQTELSRLGATVQAVEDGLRITPGRLRGGRFATYADHRMAQAGALLGLVVPGVLVEDVATTGKTLPDFVGMWNAMLAGGPALAHQPRG